MTTRRLSMVPGEALLTEGPEGRRSEALCTENYLLRFFDPVERRFRNFSASQFTDVWNHFDIDGNGFIDGDELETFLNRLVDCIIPDEAKQNFSKSDWDELVSELMTAIDTNNDNRIDLREMAQLLPTDEEFIFLFQKENKLSSSVDFMKVWKEFDKDHSGFIEADELKDFLALLMKQSTIEDEEKLVEYTDAIKNFLGGFMRKRFNYASKQLLPVEENFLCRPIFRRAGCITSQDVDRVFALYDTDNNGAIEDDELSGFLKDLLELIYDDYDENDLIYTKSTILQNWDLNRDGKINKEEMRMLLMAYSRNESRKSKVGCLLDLSSKFKGARNKRSPDRRVL
ncbi:hypothetical protein CRM22_003648 [Opisthorchis felineus]|uniref:EF-hand domain-containing protein n=1 Tax=Opisthorchis felineus TaxID=147828 RepID=A0A4S2M078_OPIFE|nr:hypothetical protein CRM22_003648 [Opisthorchis felineus]